MTDRFSASVVGRHMACPASANLEIAIPGYELPPEDRTANNAANRGTNMHEVFAKVMDHGPGDLMKMASAISYVADLRSTRRFKTLIETSMKATWLATEPDTTADLVLYTQDEIHIIDLKTGKIPVEVIDNTQLLFGAVTYGHLAPRAKGATLHILQPWADGNHSWFADTLVLKQFMADAQAAEALTQAHDVTFSPGDHCTFCAANPHSRASRKGNIPCPAMMQLLYPRVVDEDEILAL